MGSPLSLVIAEFVMQNIGNAIIAELGTRYIDDIVFCIAKEADLNDILLTSNSIGIT